SGRRGAAGPGDRLRRGRLLLLSTSRAGTDPARRGRLAGTPVVGLTAIAHREPAGLGLQATRIIPEDAMTITVTARHPALGAEIRGVDMRRPVDADTIAQIHDAWMKHLVVVFPDQQVSDAEHVAFTRHFGEPEIFHQTSLGLRA